jgi:hypothetical protein
MKKIENYRKLLRDLHLSLKLKKLKGILILFQTESALLLILFIDMMNLLIYYRNVIREKNYNKIGYSNET